VDDHELARSLREQTDRDAHGAEQRCRADECLARPPLLAALDSAGVGLSAVSARTKRAGVFCDRLSRTGWPSDARGAGAGSSLQA
jgi:hypothetical protein